jgi:hypothetical protein
MDNKQKIPKEEVKKSKKIWISNAIKNDNTQIICLLLDNVAYDLSCHVEDCIKYNSKNCFDIIVKKIGIRKCVKYISEQVLIDGDYALVKELIPYIKNKTLLLDIASKSNDTEIFTKLYKSLF